MVDLVHRLLPVGQGRTVVDIGCGTGANIAALASEYLCVGIDTSAQAITIARARYPGVRFICGAAPADLGNTAADADLFLVMDVLEHVEHDRSLLAGLVASSRPGSHFLITVPAGRHLWTGHDVAFGHYRRYEPDALRALWSELPVRERLVSFFNAYLYPAVAGTRAINRRLKRVSGVAGTDFRMPSTPGVNRLLTSLFTREAKVLGDRMEEKRPRGFRAGVSLVAVLTRTAGAIAAGRRAEAA